MTMSNEVSSLDRKISEWGLFLTSLNFNCKFSVSFNHTKSFSLVFIKILMTVLCCVYDVCVFVPSFTESDMT